MFREQRYEQAMSDIRLHAIYMALDSEVDRELLHARLLGRSYSSLAVEAGVTQAALRQRWHSICLRLREMFGSDEGTEGLSNST